MSMALVVIRGRYQCRQLTPPTARQAVSAAYVLVTLVLGMFVRFVVGVAMRHREAGGGKAHQHGDQKCGETRKGRVTHGVNVPQSSKSRNAVDLVIGCSGGFSVEGMQSNGRGRIATVAPHHHRGRARRASASTPES